MKSFMVVCLFGLAALAVASYNERYDYINVDEILDNPRALKAYFKCVLDQGKCTADGQEFKSHLKEILETGCTKCTELQVAHFKRALSHIINKEPEMWKQICDKYDPKRINAPKYEKDYRQV